MQMIAKQKKKDLHYKQNLALISERILALGNEILYIKRSISIVFPEHFAKIIRVCLK